MKILISFVGNSDPIKGNYDGPALHIIRKEKIDRVYFLLSQSMQDETVINNLNESISYINNIYNFKTNIDFVHMDIENPSLFSSFNITEYINKIVNENKGNDLFYNLSSSTPQMLAALAIDIVLNERSGNYYQVTNPEYKAYKHKKLEKSDFDNNYDNLPESSNRIVNTNINSFRTNQFKENLKSKINNKAYKDLYFYCKDFKNIIPDNSNLNILIKYAYDADSLIEVTKKHEDTIKTINSKLYRFTPRNDIKHMYIKKNITKTINYYYFLINEFDRREYISFILKMKPLFFEIMKFIIVDKIDLNSHKEWKDFLDKNQLNKDDNIIFCMLSKKHQKYHINDNRAIRLDTQELIHILDSFNLTDFKKEITEIRKHEIEVRNKLAHDLKNDYNNNTVKIQAEKIKTNLEKLFKGIITDYVNDINYSFFEDLNNEILSEISKIKGD